MEEKIYPKLYTTLFNAITEALAQMEQRNYSKARELLIQAQQETEEIYISQDI